MTDIFVGASKGLAKSLSLARSNAGHEVLHISSATPAVAGTLTVDWSGVKESDLHRYLMGLPSIDLLFFNQNSSSLSESSFYMDRYQPLDLWKQIAHWRQSYFVSCQLPFQIIHSLGDRLHPQSRICWMLSSMIVQHSDPGHADYIGNKFQNYLLMKNFANKHHSCFMGIDPGDLNDIDLDTRVLALLRLLDRPTVQTNGRVFDFLGVESSLFAAFDQ